MGRIRILPDAVANQIAAGEVVERPASVVKELLENSLDAGATDVRIEVEAGGRRLIRIADNGCGMVRDDALLAFERHATSKLRDAGDLLAISTLGFRGEALPSIASVSRLLLETKSREETTGATVEFAGGKLLRCDESALASGTTITVRDLFYNVPARRKFLRTEATELAHIASLVTHYSLAHPDKRFLLRNGVQELLSVAPVSSLRDRIYQSFGAQVLEELIDTGHHQQALRALATEPGDAGEPRLLALSGFVSRPQVQKLNRNSIYLFVNGRLIRDRLLLHAISAAYYNLIPPGSYPFALLFLNCDCEEVDVNVHPAKTEVRFRHGSAVHDFVRDTLRQMLMESRPVSAIPMPASPAPAAAAWAREQMAAALAPSEWSRFTEEIRGDRISAEPGADNADWSLESGAPPAEALDFSAPPLKVSPGGGMAATRSVPASHGGLPEGAWEEPLPGMQALTELRPLGQLHQSFVIAAGRDGLWIIDQHVAHERILFEQILAARAAGRVERQQLLLPMIVELTASQQVQFARIAEELTAMGFEAAPFGNRTVAVQAAPAGIGPAEIDQLLVEVLEIPEGEFRRVSVEDLRRNLAASFACRAAIKIHTPLDMPKMEWLLRALSATQYPMSCPHGRPIALRYSTKELLKGFHRI